MNLTLLKAIIVILFIVACVIVWQVLFIPRRRITKIHSKSRASAAHAAIDIAKIRKHQQLMLTATDVFKYFPLFRWNDKIRVEYTELIDKSNTMYGDGLMLPEELYVKCCIKATKWALPWILFGFVIKPLWFMILLAIPRYHEPMNALHEKSNRIDAEIDKQFRQFYNVYYTQFSRQDVPANLSTLIDTFLPSANPSMANMLTRFQADLVSGTRDAIDKLDLRYKNIAHVHEFCNVARLRDAGDPAAIQLIIDFNEKLKNEFNEKQAAEFTRRQQLANTVVGVTLSASMLWVLALFFISGLF